VWSGPPECKNCGDETNHASTIALGVLLIVCIGTAGLLCFFKFRKTVQKAKRMYRVGKAKIRSMVFAAQVCISFASRPILNSTSPPPPRALSPDIHIIPPLTPPATCHAQVISQFVFISSNTGSQRYPEPAATAAGVLGVSNLDVFGFVPLQCAVADTTFYHTLLLKVLGPLFVIALAWLVPLLSFFDQAKHQQAKHMVAMFSLFWIESVIAHVSYISRFLHFEPTKNCVLRE